MPGTVLISGVTVMNNTEDKVCFLEAVIQGGGREGTVNKCQVVMSAMKSKAG